MFIRSYFADYKKPIKGKATRSELRDPRFTCLEFVDIALTQESTSMLGRVFNEFPVKHVEYVNGIAHELYPISPAISAVWVNQFDTAINAIVVNDIEGEITIALNLIAQQQIQVWVEEMIAHACHELLDDDGKLKQEIIDTLNLQKVLDAWKNETKRLADVELQILYSYCVQLLLGTVTLQWQEKMLHPLTQNMCDPLLAGQLMRYIEQLFVDSKTKAWTHFYREQIELFMQSKTILKSCIAKLKKISSEELRAAINGMTEEPRTFIVDAGKATPEIWVKQIELWIDIMHYFKMQNDFERVRLINEMLSSKVMDVLEYEFLYRPDEQGVSKEEKYQLSPDMLERYMECNLFLNPFPVETRRNALPEVHPGTLNIILKTCSHFIFNFIKPRSIFQYAGFYQTGSCAAEAKIEMTSAPVVGKSSIKI